MSPAHRTLIASMCVLHPLETSHETGTPVHKAQERKQDLVKYCFAVVEERE